MQIFYCLIVILIIAYSSFSSEVDGQVLDVVNEEVERVLVRNTALGVEGERFHDFL